MSIRVEIHGIEESGTCSLTGKSGEVLVVSFADGTITDGALSHRSFLQLLRMKLAQKPKQGAAPARVEPRPEVRSASVVSVSPGNGPPK